MLEGWEDGEAVQVRSSKRPNDRKKERMTMVYGSRNRVLLYPVLCTKQNARMVTHTRPTW